MTGRFGAVRHELEETDSTQEVARELARAGAPEGTLVITEHQREGRGRGGRVWIDQAGQNLLFSLVLRPQLAPGRVPPLALVAAVAVADAVERAAGAEPRIKWPNDLLLGGRKFCGLLAEAASDGATVERVILGVGVNVNQRDFPAELAGHATSIALELGRVVDRAALLGAVLEQLERWYDVYLAHGFGPLKPEWSRRSGVSRSTIVCGDVRGTVLGIDDAGALLVSTRGGRVRHLVAGEVTDAPRR